jgi:methylmalonyl-CoA/ethylmalonyl-CoA epimerase
VPGIELDHIAIAAHRLADAPPYLMGVLGGAPYFGMSSGVFRFGQWEFDGGGRIEVLEPRGDDGFLHRFLAARGPGVHHVTFKVPSLRATCDHAEALGYTIVGYHDAGPQWKEAFLHPKEALGIVVQLAQMAGAPPRGHWRKPPPMPAAPPPPVRLVGLRLRAHDESRARRQWGELLAGAETREGARLVFRWPGSPLRIAVDIDAAGGDGPTWIEVAGGRGRAGLGDVAPSLGVVFDEAAR